MSTRFNPRLGLVVVRARLKGPRKAVELRLAVDTGATSTLVSHAILAAAGYDSRTSPDQVEIVTGSGVEYAAVVTVDRLRALKKAARNFPVVAHTLPPSAQIDGVSVSTFCAVGA
jgi:predicted aspartyl protease